MDLETENSALESIGDNDAVCSAVKIDSNGSYEHHGDSCDLNSNGNGHSLPSLDPVKTKEDAHSLNSDKNRDVKLKSESTSVEIDQPVAGSPQKVPLESPGMSPQATGTKGKGLKKWRRIKRDVTRDTTASLDVIKVLKRGSENFMNCFEVASELKLDSEASVSSTKALIDNTAGSDAFSMDGPTSNYEGSTFSVGADSENSKDRSSKSSTAASAPRYYRHDPSRASGHSREKPKMKNLVGKHPVKASQQLQQGALLANTSKKPWAEATNMDKENSLSSLESDSRSYSSVFMQGSSSVMNNGHGERLMGYDSEHGYDGQAGGQCSVDGPLTDSNKGVIENEEFSLGDATSSWQVRGRGESHQLSENGDPLVDSVRMLLSAQDALEQEIKKFGELGKDLRPLDDNSIRAAQETRVLAKKLEETFVILKEKESRIAELEEAINYMKQSNEDLGKSVEMQQTKYKEIETDMDDLFKQKMEAEIKYLTVEDKRMTAETQIKLLLDEKISPVSTQSQDHSECKEEMTDWKIQKRACRFFIQLILFILVLCFFFKLQFLPKSEMVKPT